MLPQTLNLLLRASSALYTGHGETVIISTIISASSSSDVQVRRSGVAFAVVVQMRLILHGSAICHCRSHSGLLVHHMILVYASQPMQPLHVAEEQSRECLLHSKAGRHGVLICLPGQA